ncbi:uncharacterized protein LACBIDRAFT_312091 [Laccaria bicolor S238N-H82]|uniref:Predicted protein n=1 Tax=Laccaria bicolor (strain S238N-H82 / ATCC MYA-4686) TaxID=486041 RepID=B0CZ23_LACBS|nr:uncharacterized protein LACBIDRAFT_312091 [Laccaria bicolor S238N-H82]EDR12547.1 predicted protein [Laccaria bicolor S238N-H82]|eukprot:XP_001876811.1 predicted protein [Laccaria bicolor S238N-H82]
MPSSLGRMGRFLPSIGVYLSHLGDLTRPRGHAYFEIGRALGLHDVFLTRYLDQTSSGVGLFIIRTTRSYTARNMGLGRMRSNLFCQCPPRKVQHVDKLRVSKRQLFAWYNL